MFLQVQAGCLFVQPLQVPVFFFLCHAIFWPSFSVDFHSGKFCVEAFEEFFKIFIQVHLKDLDDSVAGMVDSKFEFWCAPGAQELSVLWLALAFLFALLLGTFSAQAKD